MHFFHALVIAIGITRSGGVWERDDRKGAVTEWNDRNNGMNKCIYTTRDIDNNRGAHCSKSVRYKRPCPHTTNASERLFIQKEKTRQEAHLCEICLSTEAYSSEWGTTVQ
ncbi:hypothetical protein B0H19DRAFT_471775 [Mycena capillaripes]|nr:hypothetical protein B0H19DRAFT_471775 [Mycena capillaripes]